MAITDPTIVLIDLVVMIPLQGVLGSFIDDLHCYVPTIEVSKVQGD